MADRVGDWLKQAERDIEHAKLSATSGLHEWACFAAHQAAEKAVKALHLSAGQEAWGHVVRLLLGELPARFTVPPDLIARAQVLDGYYIPTRYPNGHPEGAPGDHYGPLHSGEAIVHAGAIVAFVRAALA